MAEKRFILSLDEDTSRAIERLAERNGQPREALLRDIIERYADRHIDEDGGIRPDVTDPNTPIARAANALIRQAVARDESEIRIPRPDGLFHTIETSDGETIDLAPHIEHYLIARFKHLIEPTHARMDGQFRVSIDERVYAVRGRFDFADGEGETLRLTIDNRPMPE